MRCLKLFLEERRWDSEPFLSGHRGRRSGGGSVSLRYDLEWGKFIVKLFPAHFLPTPPSRLSSSQLGGLSQNTLNLVVLINMLIAFIMSILMTSSECLKEKKKKDYSSFCS